jgi:hypothetical protein
MIPWIKRPTIMGAQKTNHRKELMEDLKGVCTLRRHQSSAHPLLLTLLLVQLLLLSH